MGDKSTSTLPHTITPYLAVRDAVRAIEFYKKAFGATVSIRISEASGRLGHASLKFGDSEVFLSDEYAEIGVSSPQTVGGTTFALYIHVDDVDKVTEQAVAAGAQLLREVQDEPDGDRRGTIARSIRSRVDGRDAQRSIIERTTTRTLRARRLQSRIMPTLPVLGVY